MIFQITLAGKTIQIQSLYEQVYYLCQQYLADPMQENADIDIVIGLEDIEFERKKSVKEYETQTFSDDYLETLAVYRKIAAAMLGYDSWLMHGAVMAMDQRAYMITAVSGAGKTTLMQMALKHFDASYVVNGDKPLLRLADDRVIACGTPWAGKERMNNNCQVPLEAVIILQRGEENRLEEIRFSDAFPMILQQTFKPENVSGMRKTLELLSKMGKSEIKFYRLSVKHYDNVKDLRNEEILGFLRSVLSGTEM